MEIVRGKLTPKAIAVCAAAAVTAALAFTTGASGTTVHAGNLILNFDGSVSPKALPKSTKAPITLKVDGTIATTDGSQPPASKEIIVDTDKSGEVNAVGLPVCKAGQLQATNTQAAEKACKSAIVGKGTTEVRVAFPESTPFTAKGPLVLFNGGTKGGKTLLLIQAYVAVPTPTALVTSVTITKEHDGVYGTHSVALIPTIAGGSGSVTEFSFLLHRLFTYKGKKESYLSAQCSDGHFDAHAVAKFTNGTEVAGSVVKACQSKGS